ncbi:MAG: SPOR domain-containing protein [Pseudomonadota bacterium]
MSRDYSKKKQTKRKPSATPKKKVNNSNSAGVLIYLSVGLIVGLFIAFLVFLDKQPAGNSKKLAHPANPVQQTSKSKLPLAAKKQNKPVVKKFASTTKNKTAAKKNNAQKPLTKTKIQVPEYEFYTMLPDVEVEVNVPEVVETKITKLSNSNSNSNSKQASTMNKATATIKTSWKKNKNLYQLQVGAFQSKQKAESMKAQLAFMGVQSHISSSWLTNGKKVYRVSIGPSSDEKKLKLIKAKLQKMNIRTFLKKA